VLTLSGYFFSTQKAENLPEECEDAIFIDPEAGIIAMADGVTHSFYGGPWANLLVSEYVTLHQRRRFKVDDWLARARASWKGDLKREFASKPPDFSAAVELLDCEPGAATFIGVRFHASADQTVRVVAEAIGDSCLFHFRGAAMLRTFPLTALSKFTDLPEQIRTDQTVDSVHLGQCEFNLQEHDRLLLATDTFAKHIFRAVEHGPEWLERLAQIRSQEAFAELISEIRSKAHFTDDDLSLVFATCTNAPAKFRRFSALPQAVVVSGPDIFNLPSDGDITAPQPPRPQPPRPPPPPPNLPESTQRRKRLATIVSFLALILGAFAFQEFRIAQTEANVDGLHQRLSAQIAIDAEKTRRSEARLAEVQAELDTTVDRRLSGAAVQLDKKTLLLNQDLVAGEKRRIAEVQQQLESLQASNAATLRRELGQIDEKLNMVIQRLLALEKAGEVNKPVIQIDSIPTAKKDPP